MSRILKAAKNRLLKHSFGFFESLGVHVLPVHYYSPIPDTRRLKQNPELFRRKSDLFGLRMNDDSQIELLKTLSAKYRSEWDTFEIEPTSGPTEYYLSNQSFGFASGQIQYAMVRHFKPRRIIEVGSGSSTLVTLKAMRHNDAESGTATEFTAIEPYPEPYLRGVTDPGFGLIQSKIEDVSVDIFAELEDRDLLFIDSSHVSKFGSDVNHLMFEAIPRVGHGAIVHIHDIQLPFDYFEPYITRDRYFWNEQYLVQAFLMYNREFEILWCASYMTSKYPDLLAEHLPHFDRKRIPTSLYLRRVGEGAPSEAKE